MLYLKKYNSYSYNAIRNLSNSLGSFLFILWYNRSMSKTTTEILREMKPPRKTGLERAFDIAKQLEEVEPLLKTSKEVDLYIRWNIN